MRCAICGKTSDGNGYRWLQLECGEDVCSEECRAKFNQPDVAAYPKAKYDHPTTCAAQDGRGFGKGDVVGYEAKGRAIGRLVDEKQKQYGDSFHKCGAYLRLLYPDGIRPEQYEDLLALVRDFDKSMRIANGNQGNEDAWADKCGYCLLAMKDEVA